MTQNRFNQLPRYEKVFSRLDQILNQYIKLSTDRSILKFNSSQKSQNEDGFSNSLVEDDFNAFELVNEIRSSYLGRDYLEGEIGLVDGQDQYDGIFNTTLYMLMSNRLGKLYKGALNKTSNHDKDIKNSYKTLMNSKNDAIVKLIYSLFIYKETETDNDFYYGHSIDNNGKDRLIIDLPVYGQISVHFGSKENLENIKYIAKQNIDLILKRKLELGQITEEQFNEIKSKADSEGIFPKYTGKLYEYSSAIPLDYCGEKFKMAQKDLKLSGKMVSDISDDDIERISANNKYNSRELYYFAIKSDFSKQQLEKLSSLLQKRDKKILQTSKKKNHSQLDPKRIGRKAVSLTSAEERQIVDNHEVMSDSITPNHSKEK